MESKFSKIIKTVLREAGIYRTYRMTGNPDDYDDSDEYETEAFNHLETKYAIKFHTPNPDEHLYVTLDPNNVFSEENNKLTLDNDLREKDADEVANVFDTKEDAEIVLNAYAKLYPDTRTEVIEVYREDGNTNAAWYEDWEDAYTYEQYEEDKYWARSDPEDY